MKRPLFVGLVAICLRELFAFATPVNKDEKSMQQGFTPTHVHVDAFRYMALAKHTAWAVAASAAIVPIETFSTPPVFDTEPLHGMEHRQAVDAFLASAWGSENLGFDIPSEEKVAINDQGVEKSNSSLSLVAKPATYGEITHIGARQLFQAFPGNITHFMDLGSGVGKLCIQATLEINTLQRSMGVELSQTRSNVAIATLDQEGNRIAEIRNLMGVDSAVPVEFICGDMFEADVANVTHIYVASLCFSSQMMHDLATKILTEGHSLISVATLKRFPSSFSFGEPRELQIEMTWTKPFGARVYFYDKPN